MLKIRAFFSPKLPNLDEVVAKSPVYTPTWTCKNDFDGVSLELLSGSVYMKKKKGEVTFSSCMLLLFRHMYVNKIHVCHILRSLNNLSRHDAIFLFIQFQKIITKSVVYMNIRNLKVII